MTAWRLRIRSSRSRFFVFRHVVLEEARTSAFLVRIEEADQPVEADFLDEIKKLLYVFLSLAGKAGDHGGTQSQAGHPFP